MFAFNTKFVLRLIGIMKFSNYWSEKICYKTRCFITLAIDQKNKIFFILVKMNILKILKT